MNRVGSNQSRPASTQRPTWRAAIKLTAAGAGGTALAVAIVGAAFDHWWEIIAAMQFGFWANILASWLASSVTACLMVLQHLSESGTGSRAGRLDSVPRSHWAIGAVASITAMLFALAQVCAYADRPPVTATEYLAVVVMWLAVLCTSSWTAVPFLPKSDSWA
ncbi:hypothetical protein [Cupriavidus malaysiensis]|uniref:Uncharacterized protein n=1 Tax=Cupriavidus malaysiensis TaxID=367825 RepID=A0ABM6FGL8_9BURK|nr:hypothetical protein [Cupriavidus malaysiensis]AOZ11098.1 hypothetical protein BKK80_34630 [Cupriavidus malaysiensis]